MALARSSRSLASATSKAVATTQYNVVKFVKEDPKEVQKEVPEVSFYVMKEDVGANPYKTAPLSEKIIDVPNVAFPKVRIVPALLLALFGMQLQLRRGGCRYFSVILK